MLNFRKPTRLIAAFSGILFATGLSACQPQNTTVPPQAGNTNQPSAGNQVNIIGAGASFPAPLYLTWFNAYNQQNQNVKISYQSIGSGAGINQYIAGTIDFGATDAPLTDEERQQFQAKYNTEPIQVPLTGGAIVFAYNLGGDVKNLRLSREAYCGIFQGDITTWNDPRITQQNPNVNLPNTPISFVHRSDGSGTTFLFTNHIAAACPNWKAGVGKSISFPVGIGAKGNEGVTAQIQQTQGAIGYVEYVYARQNNLNMATLQNRAGQFVEPSPESAARVLEGQTIPQNFALEIPDPAGQDAYPIVGLTWLLLYNQYDNPAKATALKNFINWALTEGEEYAVKLGYIPVSEEIAQRVQTTINEQIAVR
ncbi:phosphate-binding protein [Dulcicalothrix desertica PCC 7102]|uniref:Phosphate-binding protein n=1 Tax=Dulcicalothrix desertica PCC 7102 TaxID=232991 RepID=A0A3S1CKU1_9CYAN|nr:phosphate ABC transporter substrate-binding protein PstS [Dulcicalothrix desertica]RUT05660.1 phosphate-binding protein [Dulcicalothrix desertica PCC 7102]TWH39673.1 phosphate ABC transporter substrate-binding protein (PhoT family) [Dulcicalothrix desertica PCC 7102]